MTDSAQQRNARPGDVGSTPDAQSVSIRSPNKDEMCAPCVICCHPRCLQRFASLKLFIFVVCLLLCFAAAALAVFEGLVTTIETRYQLSASEIGLSASMFTAGTAVSTVVVTHFGGRPTSRRPAWIGMGGLCLALGATLHALPQFVLSPYKTPKSVFLLSTNASDDEILGGLCSADVGNRASGDADCKEDDRNILRENMIAYIIIVLGQTLLGVGYGPLVPLTLAYVDDNATRGTTGLASGILESMFGLGAIIGFQIASAVVRLWVDFYRTKSTSMAGLTPRDHGWVGAWWLGMLIEAVIFFVLALPLFGFPKRIPDANRDDKVSQDSLKGGDRTKHGGENGTVVEKTSALMDLKEWPRSVCRMLKSLSFLLACLSFVTEGALVYSLAAFFPKYMQVQFGLDVFMANLIAGFAFVPPWALGALLGGIIVKKSGTKMRGSAAMGVVSGLLACCLAIALAFVGCQNPPIAGVIVGYQGNELSLNPDISLDAPCNAHCMCPNEAPYTPYCGSDGVTYFSSCHAGCSKLAENNTFMDCSCLMNESVSTDTLDDTAFAPQLPPLVTRGHCPYSCSNRVTFIVLMVIWAMTLSSATSPRIIIIVSSVSPSDKSLALGISRVIMLLLGSLPFPFLYGACIDSACLVWQTLCGERGSCSIYDIERFRFVIFALTAGLIALQVVAFVAIWLIARARARERAAANATTRDELARGDVMKMASSGSRNECFAT